MSTASLEDEARELIRRGLPIVICDGKIPLGGKSWHQKIVTEADVARLLRQASNPAIGIKLGPDSVIDIESDSPDEEQLFAKLFADCDPPTTPTYTSARGKHRLFRFDDRLRETGRAVVNYTNGNSAKLGIRIGAGGKGAQSVIPPSAGREWLVSWDEVEPAALPDSVVGKILAAIEPQPASKASSKPAGAVVERARKYLAKVPPAVSGQGGHDQTFHAACVLTHGFALDREPALELLREWNQSCDPPWSDRELEHKIDSALKQPGERGYLLNGEAPRNTSRKAEPEAARVKGKPKIDTSVKDLSVVTPQVWAALQQSNNPPKLFRYGGAASRIEAQDDGVPIIRLLKKELMRYELAEAADWIERRKAGDAMREQLTAPPYAIVDNVLATPNHPLPPLTRIVEAPVFAPDGTLQTGPGYHRRSSTFYSPANGFRVPEVPEHPKSSDLKSARILICDELLCDFPFVGNAERAHAVAVLLLPFARDLIVGPTPLHLFEKPSPGTGATLLVDMLSLPATGRPIPTMTEGRDEDEWRKRITAKLRSGSPFVLIDNLLRRLDSAAVSSGITSTTWEDRVLGISEMIRLPVRCVWIATGNNPALSTEITRRTVRSRMDARLDRPWLRGGFRHENLRQWALEHRGLLVWAALTMIRAWIAAGRPPGKIKLGMFERWSEVLGGILDVAEVPGFLTNLSDFYEQSDAEGAAWRGFLGEWWEKFESAPVTVKDLWVIASGDVCLPLGDKGEQSQKIILGKMLGEKRDRVFDLELGEQNLRLLLHRGDQFRKVYQWQLKNVDV